MGLPLRLAILFMTSRLYQLHEIKGLKEDIASPPGSHQLRCIGEPEDTLHMQIVVVIITIANHGCNSLVRVGGVWARDYGCKY